MMRLPKEEVLDLVGFLSKAILKAEDEGKNAILVLSPKAELRYSLTEARELIHSYTNALLDAEKRGESEVSVLEKGDLDMTPRRQIQ